jgi:hypothetical protein
MIPKNENIEMIVFPFGCFKFAILIILMPKVALLYIHQDGLTLRDALLSLWRATSFCP